MAERRLHAEPPAADQWVPANSLEQGQVVYYTVRIRNPAAVALHDVQVTQAIPLNTRYVGHSATGTGTEISYSVNGGAEFAASTKLKTVDGTAATPEQYTHIRWRLPYALQPGAVLLARFRTVFQ